MAIRFEPIDPEAQKKAKPAETAPTPPPDADTSEERGKPKKAKGSARGVKRASADPGGD